MSKSEAKRAFELAVCAAVPAGHFNAIQVLASVERNPHPSAQRVVAERTAAAQAASSAVVAQLLRADALTKELGIDAGPLPRVPGEYPSWFGRVDAGARGLS